MSFAKSSSYSIGDFSELPVTVSADNMKYDQQSEVLSADGDVLITQGTRTINADSVTFNLTTQDTIATGNVILNQGADVIYCDAFNINLDSQIGQIQTAKIFIKEQNIHIEGNNIKKTGLSTYEVTDGTVTTCEGDKPAWKIDAKSIDVTVGGYARVRSSTFSIKGIPVLYLPYAVFPVKTKRQSGFLVPEVGHSSSEGAEFNNAFFWALSDNSDATIWLDAASKKGIGTGLEYRFKLNEDSWGKFYGYFADERDRYFDHEYRDLRDRDHERGYLNFEGEHYFNDDFYAKTQLAYVTDREFYGDYRDEVHRSNTSLRKSTIRTKEKDESVAFLNKNWQSYNLLINANVYKNLMRSGPDTLQNLPSMRFSSLPIKIAKTPLYYQLDSAYDFLWREEGQKGQRIDIFPKVLMPYTYNGWLKFKPEFGLRGLSYFNLHNEKGLDKEGLFPNITAELSANLIRVFNPDGKRIKKIRHIIEPGILYENTFSNDQRDYPDFDIPERFYRRHAVSYYVKNRLTAKILDSQGKHSETEVGYLLLGQTFNFSDPRDGLYLKGDPDEEFSDMFAEMRIALLADLYFKTKLYYNPHDSNVRYYNALLSWHNLRGDFIELEYIYGRERFEDLDLAGNIRLTSFLSAFFDVRYDTRDDEDVDTEIGFDYSSQCWGTRIYFETSSGRAGRSSDTSINVRLYLKGIGDRLL
ncbi:MAG: LPS-assembly protein LptD [Deltaproteobacteria bacterium]|nr:LPS-assembly protein LptD [Deltaproteobacteria bacterium]